LRREKSPMTNDQDRPTLSLYHRCMCVLLAYVFLITPDGFYYLSQAAVQYSSVSTLAWGKGNRIIEYDYDANGSLTSKVTTEGGTTFETVAYEYNLQNRLKKATTTKDPFGTPQTTVIEYQYNPDGIRVEKKETTSPGKIKTYYLVDPYNHTGYDQVLEETTGRYDTSDVLLSTERMQYTIGDDAISQTKSIWNGSTWSANPTQYLLYDGHGSTRQLVNADLSLQDSYSYDGYGVLLQGTSPELQNNPAVTPEQATSLLYAGEQFDFGSQHYHNRARWYNSLNGRFNQVDPYAGNMSDPQSLHKYMYVHANPINGIDPSGLLLLEEPLLSLAIEESLQYQDISVKTAAWLQVTALVLIFSIILGGGLAYTRDGSPTTPSMTAV